MKKYFPVIIGLLIAIAFIYAIYRFLPLGLAIAITGGCLASIKSEKKLIDIIGMTGGWIFIGGVIYSFIKSGWITGIISILIGMAAFGYARDRDK